MSCNETIYIENTEHCAHYLKRNKRHCKIPLFPNYEYCYKHIQFEMPMKILEKPEECSICLEEFDDSDKALKCGHWVHKSCIIKSGKNQCPICRFEIYLTPSEIKDCKNYELSYRRSHYPSYQNAPVSLEESVNRYIQNLPNHLRQHIQEVGIDNIFDTATNTNTRQGIFENMLFSYINESLHALN